MGDNGAWFEPRAPPQGTEGTTVRHLHTKMLGPKGVSAHPLFAPSA